MGFQKPLIRRVNSERTSLILSHLGGIQLGNSRIHAVNKALRHHGSRSATLRVHQRRGNLHRHTGRLSITAHLTGEETIRQQVSRGKLRLMFGNDLVELWIDSGNKAVMYRSVQLVSQQLSGTLHIGTTIGAGRTSGTLHHRAVAGSPTSLFQAGAGQSGKTCIRSQRLANTNTLNTAIACGTTQIHLSVEAGRQQNRHDHAGLIIGQRGCGIINAGRVHIHICGVDTVLHTVITLGKQELDLLTNQRDSFTTGDRVSAVRSCDYIQNSHISIV